MPRKIKIALFLLIFPALAVGHDAYLWQENEMNFAFVKLSDLGFMLTEYTPAIYDQLVDMTTADVWENYVVPFLKIKTAYFLALPSLVFLILGLRDLVKDFFSFRANPKSSQNNSELKSRKFDSKTSSNLFGSGKDRHF